jgi:hypothetical protein
LFLDNTRSVELIHGEIIGDMNRRKNEQSTVGNPFTKVLLLRDHGSRDISLCEALGSTDWGAIVDFDTFIILEWDSKDLRPILRVSVQRKETKVNNIDRHECTIATMWSSATVHGVASRR